MANDLIITCECNIKDYSDLENDIQKISFDEQLSTSGTISAQNDAELYELLCSGSTLLRII